MKKRTKLLGVLVGLFVVSAAVSVSATENVIQDENTHRFDNFTGMDENGNIYELEYEDGVIGESGISTFSRTVSPQVVNLRTKSSGVTTQYTEYKTGESGYTYGPYGADAAYLGTFDGKVRFMLAGVVGEVAEADVEIVNVSDVYVVSCYEAVDGRLIHHIAQNMKTPGYATNLDNGPAPSYIESGVTYYSYDGHYFYKDYSVMLQDYQNEVRKNSVNPNAPYYNYYQYLPLRSQSSYSADELNAIINSRVSSSSKMLNTGAAFVDNQNTYGVNALLAAGIAANESGWGASSICQNKNNLFGLNATDIMPGENADTYESPEDCIRQFAQYWMSKGYLYPNDWRYYGGFLGNKASGINVKYASDPYWGEKAANVAWSIDKSSGNKDAGKYVLGIKDFLSTEHSDLNIRKEASTDSSSVVLYKTGGQASHSFIILGESGDFYKVQSDGVLNSGRTALDNSTGEYNFSSMYAYASKLYVEKLQGTISSTEKWTAEDILTSVSSPANLGDEIELSAKIDGNTTGLQYKYVWMKDDWADWGVLQDFSENSSVTWTPESGGTYYIYMNVKKEGDATQTVTIEFEVTNWGVKSIDTSLESPQAKKTAIDIIPQIVGDKTNLQYKYVWMKDDWADWGILKEYSSSDEITWTPQDSGEYVLYVNVNDGERTITKTVEYSIVDRVWSLKGVTVEGTTTKELGDVVEISANVEKPASDLQYKFVWMKNSWSDWGVIQEFSSKNSTEWIPKETGTYYIYADVKDDEVTEHATLVLEVKQGEWDVKGLNTSLEEPQTKGSDIELSVDIEGNSTALQYKFVWMKNNWSEWGVLRDFSKDNNVIWSPESVGEYTLIVNVKDSTGAVKTKSFSYTIINKEWQYEGIELDKTIAQQVGTDITITPVVSGETDGLLYKYVWQKDSWAKWGVIKEFSNQSKIVWSAEEAGTYYIHVDVKEKDGSNLKTQIVKIVVLPGVWKVSGLSYDLESPQSAGKEILINAEITGNTTGLEYKYVWQKNNWESWGIIKPMNAVSSVIWTPEENGEYTIYMDVKDKSGQSTTYSEKYVVADWVLSAEPADSVTVGDKVLISVNQLNENMSLQYKFVWQKDSWASWGVLQALSDKSEVEWTPKEKGTYYIYVDIKNMATGKVVTQTMKYLVK